MIFSVFQKNRVWGILGPPYCCIGATIRIGRELLCLPYAGFFQGNWVVYIFSPLPVGKIWAYMADITAQTVTLGAKTAKNYLITLYSFIFLHKNGTFWHWPFFFLFLLGITLYQNEEWHFQTKNEKKTRASSTSSNPARKKNNFKVLPLNFCNPDTCLFYV